MNHNLKVCLIGGSQTGKTTFAKTHLAKEYSEQYNPTMGVEVYSLVCETNCGSFTLNIWDTAGNKDFEGLKDGYYLNSSAAIAFYTKDKVLETNEYVEEFKQVCPDVPIINVWNKSDVLDENIFFEHMNKSMYDQFPFQISIKDIYNFERPFLEILKNHTGNPYLEIINIYANNQLAYI